MASTAPRSTSILIVGTGALATLFAWRLRRAGYNITLLGSWQPGVRALRANGARLVDSAWQAKRLSQSALWKMPMNALARSMPWYWSNPGKLARRRAVGAMSCGGWGCRDAAERARQLRGLTGKAWLRPRSIGNHDYRRYIAWAGTG